MGKHIQYKSKINESYFNFLKENMNMNVEFDRDALYSFDYVEDKMQPQCVPGFCDEEDYYSVIRRITRSFGVKPRDWGDIYLYMNEYNYDVSPDQMTGIKYEKEPIKGINATIYRTEGGELVVDYTMSDGYPVLWFKNYNDAVNYLTWADEVNSNEG